MRQRFRKKLVKKVMRRIPWIEHIINDEKTAGDLNIGDISLEIRANEESQCLTCRGSKMACKKPQCPIIVRLYSLIKAKNLVDAEQIVGSSPPGVFVGRIGYPYVYAGPLVPPVTGNTSIFDAPEEWVGKGFDELIGFRTALIRGKFRVNVKKHFENEQFLRKTLEIALSKDPVDTEISFESKPSNRFLFDDHVPPMGPSALLKTIRLGGTNTDFRIEKFHADGDLRAEEAIYDLFSCGVPVSKIQRAFSVGALGLRKQRRIVPTRWSITAIDSMISRKLIDDEVKDRPFINEHRVYEFNYLGNRFIVLLTPSTWQYEWIEAWYPGTVWNQYGQRIAMGADWEGYRGRTTYASLGGCYYAVRLAAAEFLARERKQAGVIAMREIYPSFITPLGVWINRECVREALRRDAVKFDTFREAMSYIGSRLAIGLEEWIITSTLLKEALYQEKLTKYIPHSL